VAGIRDDCPSNTRKLLNNANPLSLYTQRVGRLQDSADAPIRFANLLRCCGLSALATSSCALRSRGREQKRLQGEITSACRTSVRWRPLLARRTIGP
jgi:hypothetical protein